MERIDPETAAAFVGLCVLVILFRSPLASAALRLVRWLMSSISITMTDEMEEEAGKFMRILLVAGSLLLTLETLSPPEFAGGFFRKVLISVLVLAIFAAWYRLVEPMIGLIGPDKITGVRLDTSWMVRLGQFVVVLMSITAFLEVWNIDISNALTGVGVLGAGLAIASQDFIRNLIAGMNNMSEKRFETGDWIAVQGGVEGTVTRVDVRSTTVMGFDHVPHYVPNSELSNAIVLNKSRMDHRRISWTIGLVRDATDAQLEAVCEALLRHMRESGDFVTAEGFPLRVIPFGLSDSAIEIRVQGFTQTKDYQPYLEASGRLVSALRRALREAGTELAYPTRTLHLTDRREERTSPP
ncbi:mechanosensitive ion channel family protein [Tropicimonas sp. TH_r6]|uniref:mechanosensitive ion channel family protein n=1 Tax=Tropicimonas sp. TH_r6 TaxID=3082085 RepID=UPI00295591A9|nr:mechanosensitive ion channel family protein [Tropicimonas sp. TH_r6]MDV7144317.1 mechanosensitive ion channel family protein [Tropicimonas sp. TH_r6]